MNSLCLLDIQNNLLGIKEEKGLSRFCQAVAFRTSQILFTLVALLLRNGGLHLLVKLWFHIYKKRNWKMLKQLKGSYNYIYTNENGIYCCYKKV